MNTKPAYDLLIRGATVVDPSQDLHEVRDIAVSGDRIAALGTDIPEEQAATVIDAGGKLATPGLIDLHVHVWWGVAHLGIPPDPNCVARGVTTVYDAGSAGADTFPGFKKYVIDVSATRIFAFLHVSSQGQLNHDIGELTDLRYADVPRAIRMCEENRDAIVGIKIRMGGRMVGDSGAEALKRAREVSDATGLPLMIHPNASPVSLKDQLSELRSGDIVTHCFHKSETGILNADGAVRPEARKAFQEGILFDVGHGAGSFSFPVAEAALAQDFIPGTISSDLHHYNLNGPVFDLATTLSKFLMLGMSLDDAVRRVTQAPAEAMGMSGTIGALVPGACADVALFDLEEGEFTMMDAQGETRIAPQRLVPVSTLRDGRLYTPTSFN